MLEGNDTKKKSLLFTCLDEMEECKIDMALGRSHTITGGFEKRVVIY